MKKWLQKIYEHRYFVLFIMLFAYVQSIYVRIFSREEINLYTFTPEAMVFSLFQAGVLFYILLSFLKKWQRSIQISTPEILKIFSFSLFVYLLAMKLSGFGIALLFDTVARNFNQTTFFLSMFSDFLNGFIFGSFFLAYYFYHKNKNHQAQLAIYHQALSESKIYNLKAQLNPHFLFNNLNVLDQFIEEDKYKASAFLNEFADIYRYVLQASDKKLIGVAEELDFAVQYFKLIEHKYGGAYLLKLETKPQEGFIVPLTLQLLIENAVQHNLGTVSQPICITIQVSEHIQVSNNLQLKRSIKPTQGRALNNVKAQYALLTKTPVEVNMSNDQFSVTIPLIQRL